MNRNRTYTFFLIVIIALVSGAACRHSNEQRYELKGKVVAVEKDKRLVTVAHEDIKGYMPGMVMPFSLKDDWPFDILVSGDQITATLVVDRSASWLEDVVITKESIDKTSAKDPGGLIEAKAGDEVPNFILANQDGKRITLNEYRGKAWALTFIYTRCPVPEYCTLMSNNFAEIDRELQKQPELYAKTHLLSISIDPEYDTPKVLRSYGAAHTSKYSDETFAHWEFVSGTNDEVKGIAQFFGLRYYAGTDQIIHSLRTAVVGPDGKVVKVYRGNEWKPEEIVRDLSALLEPKQEPKNN